jgi:CRP-like cAMP-binding protein
MDNLKAFVYVVTEPTEKEWQHFASLVKTEIFEKGKNVIRAGNVCDKIYFVNAGILRYFVLLQEKEKSIDIAMDNDLVTDFFSFYSGKPAVISVQCLAKSELLSIAKNDLETLYRSSATWERFGRLLAQKGLLEQIMEKLDMKTKSPEQRYTELITRKPTLLDEVNLGIIASCLDITQETLSRIRSRILQTLI